MESNRGRIEACFNAIMSHIAAFWIDYFVIIIGTLIGGILGVFMTAFVMEILAALSTSGVLNIYYGGILFFIGSFLTFNVYRKSRVSLD